MRRTCGVAKALLCAMLTLVLLAACSGSGSKGSGIASASGGASKSASGSPSPASTDPSEARLQLTQCLRDQGLDVPDVNPNDPGSLGQMMNQIPEAKRNAAIQACQQYLEGMTNSTSSPGAFKQDMFNYIKCLRQNGAKVDDPDPTTGRPDQKTIDTLQHPDATTQKALDACQDQRPGANGAGQ
jgi:hypothetical protein